jgi:glycosyltransferase involved in cell wall biosynthesis
LSDNAPDNFEIFVAVGEKDGKKDLQEKFKNNPRVKIIQLKHLKRKISPANDVLAIFELKKIFNKINPDIIHLNSSKAGILGSLTKLMGYNKNNSARIIYTVHGWVFNEPNRKLGRIIYRWLEKITSTYKDKIIVLSEKEKNDAINLKIGKNKLIKIPLGIKIPKFLEKNKAREIINKLSDAKTVKHLSNQDIWFGTVANFYKSKGLDILIESINILNLKQSRKNYQFFLLVMGQKKRMLKNYIKNII